MCDRPPSCFELAAFISVSYYFLFVVQSFGLALVCYELPALNDTRERVATSCQVNTYSMDSFLLLNAEQ